MSGTTKDGRGELDDLQRSYYPTPKLSTLVPHHQLLNPPHNLKTVRQGDEVLFVVPTSGEHLLQVREKYLRERGDWIIHPCNKCGLSELFDAPSELIRKVFPNTPADAVMSMFTAFCGVCGGVQVVQHKSYNPEGEELAPEKTPPKKKWWQFWK